MRTQKRKWEFNEDSPVDPNIFSMFGQCTVFGDYLSFALVCVCPHALLFKILSCACLYL